MLRILKEGPFFGEGVGKGRRERDNPFLVNNYDSLDMNNLSVNDTIQPKGVDKTPLGLVGLIKQLGMVLISILY